MSKVVAQKDPCASQNITQPTRTANKGGEKRHVSVFSDIWRHIEERLIANVETRSPRDTRTM